MALVASLLRGSMAKRAQASPAAADDSRIADFTKEEELAAYRSMLLIRRFEEKAGQLYGMGAMAVSAISISARKLSSSACRWRSRKAIRSSPVSYTHLRAHET